MRERDRVRVGLLAAQQALLAQRRDDLLARLEHRQAGVRAGACSFIRPSSPITVISPRPWRRPISKSLGSCPGVIFRQPVPKSVLT